MEGEGSDNIVVIGETVVTLHQRTLKKGSCSWETIGYGIPSLTGDNNHLTFIIVDIHSSEILHKFEISDAENYVAVDKHFHVFCCSTKMGLRNTEECCFGFSFAHENVAEKFYQTVIQQLLEIDSQPTIPQQSVIGSPEEMIDFPPDNSELLEEAGALTLSGKFPVIEFEESVEDKQSLHVLQVSYGSSVSEEEVLDDVDFAKKTKKVKKKRISFKRLSKCRDARKLQWSSHQSSKLEDIQISYPVSVKHMAHVHPKTPFDALKEVVNTGTSTGTELHYDVLSLPTTTEMKKLSLSANPAIIVTPVAQYQRSMIKIPSPLIPAKDFEILLKELKVNEQIIDDHSKEAWQHSFQFAVSNAISKALQDSLKVVSFTQSGREKTVERGTSRNSSMIIHDHGSVSL